MSNTQYAVCHLQRGSGNDSGMSCHKGRMPREKNMYPSMPMQIGRTSIGNWLYFLPG